MEILSAPVAVERTEGMSESEIFAPPNIITLSSKRWTLINIYAEIFQKIDSCVCVVSSSKALMPITEFPFWFSLGLHTATE